MSKTAIKPLVSHGYEFVAGGKVLAEVFDPSLVRLFEHADGVTIYDGRFMVAKVFPVPVERQGPMARQFAASNEMLELLKMFVEAHAIEDSQLMRVTVDEAQALIEKVEGE